MRNHFVNRMIISLLFFIAPCASSHIKWIDLKFNSVQNVEIVYSESLVPFVPERAFTAGAIKIRDNDNIYEINKMVQSIESMHNATKITIKYNGNINALYLHPTRTIKPSKYDRGSGKYLPPRIELSRLSFFPKNAAVEKSVPPQPDYLDALPVYTPSHTKADKKYAIQVFRDGKAITPSSFFIYNSVKNSFITDYKILDNGQIEFVPDAGSKYLFQADELIFTPGTTGMKGIAHTHLYASLIFST